jgi:hypothetical protein
MKGEQNMRNTALACTHTEVERALQDYLALMRYRLATREDLVDGAQMIMIDASNDFMFKSGVSPEVLGTKIKLDFSALKKSNFPGETFFVYYHCIDPSWDGDCFVPLEIFLGEEKTHCGSEYRYIVPLD